MTRNDYRQARRMLRDNGTHAFRWMRADVAASMQTLDAAKPDLLDYRAWIAHNFGHAGIAAELRFIYKR